MSNLLFYSDDELVAKRQKYKWLTLKAYLGYRDGAKLEGDMAEDVMTNDRTLTARRVHEIMREMMEGDDDHEGGDIKWKSHEGRGTRGTSTKHRDVSSTIIAQGGACPPRPVPVTVPRQK